MSFTAKIIEILELTKNNEFARSLLLDSFYENLPSDINKRIKSVFNRVLSGKNKSQYTCLHEGCAAKSCYSHELAENVFLKYLSDEDNNVCVLKPDLAGNATSYVIRDDIHKRNASNFPGYCSSHDLELFSDIESGFLEFDDKFINKQCLRTARREIFEIDHALALTSKIIKELGDEEFENDEEIDHFVLNLKNRVRIQNDRKEKIKKVYNEINNGIKTKSYIIEAEVTDVKKLNYCFSSFIDLTLEDDEDTAMFFIYKLEYEEQSKFIVAYLNNTLSKDLLKNLSLKNNLGKWFVSNLMYEHKEKLIFSKEFIKATDSYSKKILFKNQELYRLTPMEQYFLSEILF